MSKINTEIYDELGERWYSGHGVEGLLRAESRPRDAWVLAELGSVRQRVLDLGCGGGILSNKLAIAGHQVWGVDQSGSSLEIARAHDRTKSVKYEWAIAYELPYANDSFDAVVCMDFLEHVEDPQRVLSEVARVLRPKGKFYYHTFNRNWISWLVVIKFVEWFIDGAPDNLHLYRLLIKPSELRSFLLQHSFSNIEMQGLGPIFVWKQWYHIFRRGRVPEDFPFKISNSLLLGYIGKATLR